MAGEVDALLVKIDATSEALRRELQRADRSISGFERNADRSIGMVERRFDRMGTNLGRSVSGLGALLGGAAIGRDVLATVVQYEQLDQRLRTLTGSAEGFAEAQTYIRDTSKRLSTDLAATTESYSRLLTLQNAGLLTSEQSRALLEGFADAAAATGASTQSLNQVMYGLSQALSSGVVRAEEFNQVTEPMPGLLQAMEKAAGLSAGGLRKLVNEGRVTSDVFGRIMVEALKTFSGEAEKRADTLGGKWVQLNNQWDILTTSLSTPIVDVLAPLLGTANDLLAQMGPLLEWWTKIEAVAARARRLPAEAAGILSPDQGAQRARLEEERDKLQRMLAARTAPGGPFTGEAQAEQGLIRLQQRLRLVQAQIVAMDGVMQGPNLPVQGPNLPTANTGTGITFGAGKGDAKGNAARKKAEREAEAAWNRALREAEQDTGAIGKLTDELALLEAVNEQERIRIARAQAVAAASKDINNPELRPVAEQLAGQLFDAERAMETAQKVAEEGRAVYDATRTATEEYSAKVQRLNELLMQGAINQETFGRATQQAKEELARASEGTRELETAILGGLQHAVVSLGGNFKNLEQVAVSAISHIITELIRMQQTADAAGKTGPLSGIISSATTFLGGLFGGGGASLGPTVPGASAYGIPGGGFAMGGRPPVGIPSLVGERGPEVFVPDVAGTIVPNFAVKPQGNAAGPQQVHLSVALSDDLDARLDSRAENVSLRVVRRESPKIVSESVAATRASASEYPIR